MDRRQFRIAEKNNLGPGKPVQPQIDPSKEINDVPKEDPRLAAIREFGERLQVKAEKMRLLARAEEGLGDGELNPYSTVTIPADKILELVKPVAEPEHVPKAPASNARVRRRKKQSAAGPRQPTVNIKDYRPGYTWNKGGRVKEIRIRTLARKFFHIWRWKVFGRVTPSQARAHYERRILKLTFRAWHNMWWELRKEWRLIIRAECHHRYVLWLKTFRAWRDFIVKQKIKNTKIALAEQHATIKLTRKCLDSWRGYMKGRREKRKLNVIAQDHHSHVLLRECWRKWVESHETVLARQHMEDVALQFWAYRVQAQYWLQWQERMTERRKGVMNQYKAIRHYNTVCVRHCLKSWVQYWAHRRQKKQEKEYGILIYHKGLISKYFAQWMEAFRFREALFERQERILLLADTFQKRKYFLHWRHYIEQEHEKLELMADAENHYQRKLMSAGLSAFRLCVIQRKLKSMRTEMANQLRCKQLTRWAFNTWLSRCDNNEELRMIAQSQKARKHYRSVLLAKCFAQVQNYARWRRYRQSQYARADAHFYMTVMPKCMFHLKMFVDLMKTNRENAHNAQEFRRENVLARFFYFWVNQFELSKENRMNERMAILHHEAKVMRSHFSRWKHRTTEALTEADNEVAADDHLEKALKKKYFIAWTAYIQDLKKSQRQDIEATTHYRKVVERKCTRAWIRYTKQRLEKKRKKERAQHHYKTQVCRRMVAMWLHYVDIQRAIRERAEVMYRRKSDQRLRELFQVWRDNVVCQVEEREADTRAIRHHSHRILARTFTAWHRFSAIHAYKKSETRQWVETARNQLNFRMLQIYFIKWKDSYAEHMSMRLLYERAVNHHDNKVKVMVINTWRQFTQESVRKTLLQKQCDWFHNVRLTARYFVRWKHVHAAAQVEKEKTNLALWHWCLTLHRKVLVGWYSYVQQKKMKKARITMAMERRRCRLLRDGLAQWLSVADDLSAMRKTFAAQQQAKSVYETYQVVLRCGLHWKHWASRQREARGGAKPRPPPGSTPGSKPSTARGGHSSRTTPRTPRDITPSPLISPRFPVELPPPVLAVSPGREKFPVPKTELSQPCVRPQPRARPRQPDFLAESLKRAGLFSPGAISHEHLDLPDKGDSKTAKSTQVMDTLATDESSHVEMLNLTGLSSNRSDTDSVPFKQYSDHQGLPSPHSDRSNLDTPHVCDNHPQTEKKIAYELAGGKGDQSGVAVDDNRKILMNVDKSGRSKTVVPNVVRKDTVLKSAKVQLMTPADFLIKRVEPPSQELLPLGDDKLTPRTLQALNIHSECTSTVSTPRVLCQSSNHTHPLYETLSFKPGDFQGGLTPRSVASTPRLPEDRLSAPVCDSNRSTTSHNAQKEIVVIRNRLKSFDQKKKKLKTMQKQLKQLCDWLVDMESRGQGSDDEDVRNARQEVQELTADVETLRRSVEEEKIRCTGLVDRVKVLMAHLTPT